VGAVVIFLRPDSLVCPAARARIGVFLQVGDSPVPSSPVVLLVMPAPSGVRLVPAVALASPRLPVGPVLPRPPGFVSVPGPLGSRQASCLPRAGAGV